MSYIKKTWGENDYFTNQDANEMSEAIADLSKSSGIEYVSINVDDVFDNGENLLTAEDIEKIQRGAFIKLYSSGSNSNNGGGGNVLMAASIKGGREEINEEEEIPLLFVGTCLPSGEVLPLSEGLNGIKYSSNITFSNGNFGFFDLTIQIASETESLILGNWISINTVNSDGGDIK